jgi:hexosaminidase
VSRDLEWRGMRHVSSHHSMLERLADGRPAGPLATLSDVVEPVKEYTREEARLYTSFTPLNRLVDATRPESDVAREFGLLVDRAKDGDSDAASSRDHLRNWLTQWQANDPALAPALEDSFLLQELIPLSKDLAALGSAGLEALEFLASNRKPLVYPNSRRRRPGCFLIRHRRRRESGEPCGQNWQAAGGTPLK